MTVQVVARPQVNDDLFNLPSAELRFMALSFIVGLEYSPFLGSKLMAHPQYGDLSDCRKVYFDERRYRVIYRLLPDEIKPETADVIIVGPRESAEVYVEALIRLGRPVALP